jgi:hypothetical protein
VRAPQLQHEAVDHAVEVQVIVEAFGREPCGGFALMSASRELF